MTENAPNGKVLSGEVIVFQNEVQDTFRKLINMSEAPLDDKEAQALAANASSLLLVGEDQLLKQNGEFKPLSCRYCLSIIEEYNRCLMEH